MPLVMRLLSTHTSGQVDLKLFVRGILKHDGGMHELAKLNQSSHEMVQAEPPPVASAGEGINYTPGMLDVPSRKDPNSIAQNCRAQWKQVPNFLALLVQNHKYWYKSTDTEAAGSRVTRSQRLLPPSVSRTKSDTPCATRGTTGTKVQILTLPKYKSTNRDSAHAHAQNPTICARPAPHQPFQAPQ